MREHDFLGGGKVAPEEVLDCQRLPYHMLDIQLLHVVIVEILSSSSVAFVAADTEESDERAAKLVPEAYQGREWDGYSGRTLR